ncbi:hypothetical protein PXH66_13500 [Synoicihabitans lomoniglobus]|uniref:Uncharacterized protein n=1 Tax=Synoicihabitans lomoniglobus TaxID=2909285 RepID=A0AAF0CLX5_9BACT|nr:hypothetical protein PXH66_13500 [Opitutaceae bacterium LMO-M01]
MIATMVAALAASAPPVGADTMREKITGNLQAAFQFDPAARETLPDNDDIILMEPVVVQEQSLSRGLENAVDQERSKLTPTFNIQEGGEFIKDAFGRITVQAKPHQDPIPTGIGKDIPIARWSLLQIKW